MKEKLMSRFTRMAVLNAMYEIGLVPVFYHSDVEVAKKIAVAVADGGAKVVEFTNRGDFAYQVFADLNKFLAKERPEVILGVGSIVDASTAALYIANGANFVVGPILNPEVARQCNRRKIPYSPGCGSATEVQQAEELGCEIVKVFPGEEVGGPKFVKSVKGPCPWTSIMPTGGVRAAKESVEEWIKAGAAVLGIGSDLITKELVASANYAAITQRTKDVLGWIKQARASAK
jgi:2-dehydro-3-deoxyphosphogluconate aldolase/(4S)-4-hydroxy-2-oxoglutarate aldolase